MGNPADQDKKLILQERKNKLSPQSYHITQEAGTEPPFTGPHLNEKREGAFVCVVCGQELFSSRAKYDSGSGWPSFYEPVIQDAVNVHEDMSHGMVRTEVICASCEAHLGHVFPDGPKPSGLRFCINGHALEFIPEE